MPARRYPPEQFAGIVTLLVDCLDATVILTGTEEECDLVATITRQLPPAIRGSVYPIAGKLPFADFCGLIQAADLVVTNNTGPMHMAAALKTPVVALFALTNSPEQWGPWRVPHRLLYYDVPCRMCYSRVCPRDQDCLRLVPPERAVEAAAELLAERVLPVGRSPFAASTLHLNSAAAELT
jgi:ADP-heptose:LPS heptosyltransferase